MIPDSVDESVKEVFPTVSVLVLAYNHERFIGACLRSLIGLDYPNIEINVLDDGSSDGTVDEIERVAATTHVPIRLIRQKNSGHTARNSQALVDRSGGAYLLLMSGDDMLAPGFPLREHVDWLESDAGLGFVLPRLLSFHTRPEESETCYYKNARFLAALRSGSADVVLREHLYREVSAIFLQGMLVRRSLMKTCGGFDVEITADDYALVFRLFHEMQRGGMGFRFNERAFWIYRIHTNNIHQDVLRQLSLIMEVVSKYVPMEYWLHFNWHLAALDNFGDLEAIRRKSLTLFGDEAGRRLAALIVGLTLRSARRAGNRQLLWRVFRSAEFSWKTRLRAIRFLFTAR